MEDEKKSKRELIRELTALRERVATFERVEDALRQSEEIHRSIVENVDAGITMIDAGYGIAAINPAQARMFVKTADELVGKKCYREFEKRDAPCADCPGAEAMAIGRPAERERTGVRDDGSQFAARVKAFPVSKPDGAVTGFIELVEDVTARRQDEQRRAGLLRRLAGINRLQEELLLSAPLEEKLGKITEAAVDLLDLDFCRIWSVRPADLCGKGCIHATATDEPHAYRRRDRCLHLMTSSGRYTHTDGNHRRVPFGSYKIGRIASGDEQAFLTNSVTTDPRVHDHQWAKSFALVSFAGYRLHDANGEPTGVLAMFAKHPISEEDHALLSNLADTTSKVILECEAEEELRRQTALAEAANRAKSEFLANMSHEIRTPMTAVLGFADLLATSNLPDPEHREFLEGIRRNGQALLELISDILDLSRIEADKLTMEPRECALREIVDGVMSVVEVRARAKGLALGVDYRCPMPQTIRTDPLRLRQILVNLAGNAIKFTERGEVRLTVRCLREGKRGARVQFAVSDTGIGIPAEKIGDLFQPFMQADSSATRRYGGTGLGLAISKRLAAALGGGIEVVSEPGKGSTFTLTIDAGPLDGVAMLAASQEAPAAAGLVQLCQ